jgi:hypothetical protein
LEAVAKNLPAWRIGCNAAASGLAHFADDELIANESVGCAWQILGATSA